MPKNFIGGISRAIGEAEHAIVETGGKVTAAGKQVVKTVKAKKRQLEKIQAKRQKLETLKLEQQLARETLSLTKRAALESKKLELEKLRLKEAQLEHDVIATREKAAKLRPKKKGLFKVPSIKLSAYGMAGPPGLTGTVSKSVKHKKKRIPKTYSGYSRIA